MCIPPIPRFLLFALLAFPVVIPITAPGAERVAPVIGNDVYRYAQKLGICVNDATDIRAALGKAGFNPVIFGTDLNRPDMLDKVDDFLLAAKGLRGVKPNPNAHDFRERVMVMN